MRLTLPFTSRGRNGNGADPAPGLTPPSRTVFAPNDEAPLFNEELLARLRRLTILSRRTIAEGLAGEHRSKRRGSSPEFADFKSYSQGDDFRRIDWNIYARLDEVFVRLSEVTTELTIHVLLDASNSMDWRSSEDLPSKFRYARLVAGSICYVSLFHFDRVIVTPFGTDLGTPFGPAQGHAHVTPMLNFLSRLPTLGSTDLPTALDRYTRARRRPGIMLLVSDMLSGEPDQIEDGLRLLRGRGWQTIVVHIVDEGELSPTGIGVSPNGRAQQTELIEVESGQRLKLTPTRQVLDRYEAEVTAWLEQIKLACEHEHIDYLRLHTDWPFETIVLKLLHQRGVVA